LKGYKYLLFSRGWLDGFKSRFNLLRQYQHGKAGSANPATFKLALQEIQHIVDSYAISDVYDADETTIFWKPSSNYTLSKNIPSPA
jgi:hypothetical protein